MAVLKSVNAEKVGTWLTFAKRMNKKLKARVDRLVSSLSAILSSASSDDITGLIGDGILQKLIESIAKPKTNKEEGIYNYFLRNKIRLQILALIRLAIHVNYPVRGKVKGTNVYVSPHHVQWFKDGVMFIQGEKQYEGLIGLYQKGQVKFAIARRDRRAGESMGPDDFEFIDVNELQKRSKQPSVPISTEILDSALVQLQAMLSGRDTNESTYQKFFQDNPWILGAQYKHIQSHQALDDVNIPDFTGTRIHDGARDILEIKQPFIALFRSNNTFRSELNNAWNQAERYLDFARSEADYLHRQKGLRFENPRCYLIAGYKLNEKQRLELRRKERMNTAITLLTYDDVLAMGAATVAFIKQLKKNE